MTDSQSAVCPGVRPQLVPVTTLSFSLKFSLDSCGFVILRRPLWREVWSVIYCCCLASPAQSLSGLSPAGLKTIFDCPNFWDSPNLEGQVPKDRVALLYPRTLGSLSITSYDSQGRSQSRSYITTDGQYVLVSSPLWDLWPDITSCRKVAAWNLQSCFCEAPSLTRGRIWSLLCNHSMVRVAQNP
jgi:hypothetical protein